MLLQIISLVQLKALGNTCSAGLGLAIEEDSVPLLPETVQVCEALGLDPMGLLASGALLITLPPEDVPGLLSALEKAGVDAWEIGRMLAAEEGLVLFNRQGEEVELPVFNAKRVLCQWHSCAAEYRGRGAPKISPKWEKNHFLMSS